MSSVEIWDFHSGLLVYDAVQSVRWVFMSGSPFHI
jgi:hypothetical protein